MKGIVFAALALFQASNALSKGPSSTSEEVVTVTTTRTFTNYCGCGVPGVSTIVGPIPGSTTTTSRTTETTSASSTTTDSTTTSSLSATTTTTTSSSALTTSSTTTTSAGPIVTDQAYIDTVLRHHNIHRSNHSAAVLTWSSSLAEISRMVSQSCFYQPDTTINGGGYGQSIGAGYPSTAMGPFITEGIYNLEFDAYTAYGNEPDYGEGDRWGRFTQMVWRSTASVGCYTFDCSNQPGGLESGPPGVPPFFTVCSYDPSGNLVGDFAPNVGAPLGLPSINGDFGCNTRANCVGLIN